MKHRSSFKKLGFAFALILCPALGVGSISPALAANDITINTPQTEDAWGDYDGMNYGPPVDNKLTISGSGVVDGWAGGAYNDIDDATGNSVLVGGGTVTGSVIGAEGGDSASVIDNHVTIDSGSVGEWVYGGGSWGTGEVSENTVTINGGNIGEWVFGGRGEELVSGNAVTVTDGSLNDGVTGGYSGNGEATGNTVEWTGGTVIGNIFGGDGMGSTGNSVLINGAGITHTGLVDGGYGIDLAAGNSVTLELGELATVIGGESEEGDVTENTVTINGGTVTEDIYGGWTESGEAIGNIVEISDGAVAAVFGGVSYTGQAAGNRVTMSGGETERSLTGGWAESGDVEDNTVILTGGTVSGDVLGGSSVDGAARNNSVKISGGSVAGGVWGAFSDSGTVTGNSAVISGGTVIGDIYGGGGESGAVGNSVAISDGTVNAAFIIGGYSDSGEATGNKVEISGGAVGDNAKIYGGYGDSTATGNIVTISGTPTWGDNVSLYGGYSVSDDDFSGNTLNLKTPGLTVSELANFEYLNFYLPTDFKADETMLSVTGTASLTDGADRSSIVNVGIDGNSSVLKAGDSMVLIDAGTLVTNADLNETATGYGRQGSTLDYLFSLATDGNKLLATVEGVKASEGSKSLSEGVVSGLALTAQGSDLAAGEGLGQAVSAAALNGFGSFGAMGAGSLKYDTGSSVDVNGFSLMTGLAFGNTLDAGRLTLGAFFEYGNGSYDTHNSFSGVSVDGGGDTDYVGGGLLGRMDFADTASGHFYTEASGRMGRVSNEFNGSDLIRAYYDSSASYFGLHAGLGYVWNVGEKTFLDLYGKYLWTHQGGDSVKLSTGDPLEFEAADSHRVRVGGRLSYQANENIAPYVGAAYEHEFDGEALASTYGYAIDAPDMKGGTGMGELGFTLKPSADSPVSFDLGLQGYTGVREGVTGSLQVKFEF